ncbi:MAG: CBS domain-containing protein [Candidatus Manganitrophus sp. SA1]|nr:CBS domain-containing protein [Candidatus Manganitrophus morganii]
MSTKIYSIGSEKNVRSAAEEMTRNKIGSLLVTQEGNYTGIITEVDIIRKVVAKGIDPAATTVRTVMTSPLITIEADRSVLDANDLMEQKKIRHIGVTRNGKIIGMVSIRDFLHPLSVEQPSDAEQKASGF